MDIKVNSWLRSQQTKAITLSTSVFLTGTLSMAIWAESPTIPKQKSPGRSKVHEVKRDNDYLEVKVASIIPSVGSNILTLVPTHGNDRRALKIGIGDSEALAIGSTLHDIDLPRPMTHDVLLKSIQHLVGKVEHVILDDFRENTYFATICLRTGKELKALDTRPSDGVALAMRAKCNIYIALNVQKMMVGNQSLQTLAPSRRYSN